MPENLIIIIAASLAMLAYSAYGLLEDKLSEDWLARRDKLSARFWAWLCKPFRRPAPGWEPEPPRRWKISYRPDGTEKITLLSENWRGIDVSEESEQEDYT